MWSPAPSSAVPTMPNSRLVRRRPSPARIDSPTTRPYNAAVSPSLLRMQVLVSPFSKGFLAHKLIGLKARAKHAFAVVPECQPPSLEDMALLEGVASTAGARGMAPPGLLCLEP